MPFRGRAIAGRLRSQAPGLAAGPGESRGPSGCVSSPLPGQEPAPGPDVGAPRGEAGLALLGGAGEPSRTGKEVSSGSPEIPPAPRPVFALRAEKGAERLPWPS